MRWIFAVHFAATWYMVGVIWVVQILHYPMMGRMGAAFPDCQRFHLARTGGVVGPPMLVEAGTALALFWASPDSLLLWVLTGLLAIIWASTFLLQVPCHNRLNAAFDASVHASLVRTNWIRTICWTIRGLVLTSLLAVRL